MLIPRSFLGTTQDVDDSVFPRRNVAGLASRKAAIAASSMFHLQEESALIKTTPTSTIRLIAHSLHRHRWISGKDSIIPFAHSQFGMCGLLSIHTCRMSFFTTY